VLHPALGHVLHVLQAQRVAVVTLGCDGLPPAAAEAAAQQAEDEQPTDVEYGDAAAPAEKDSTENDAHSAVTAAAPNQDGEVLTAQAASTSAAGTVVDADVAASPPQLGQESDTGLEEPVVSPPDGRAGASAAGDQDADAGAGPAVVERSEL
jgi:hypothetical protein